MRMILLLLRILLLLLSVATTTLAVKVFPRNCGGAVRHVHLAVGPDPTTSMIVSFASIPSKFAPPVAGVLVGTTPGQLTEMYLEDKTSPTSYNVTYSNKRMTNYENRYYAPHYHHITVHSLEPNTVYYYQPIISAKEFDAQKYNLRRPKTKMTKEEMVQALEELDEQEDEETNGRRQLIKWPPYNGSEKECPSPDKIRSFRTAPPPSQIAANFAIIGDLGQFPHSEETMARLIRSRHDMDAAILAGDVAYTSMDHRRWDTFFDFLDDYPLFERIPLQICPGNHDIDKTEETAEIFLAYEHRFRMPRLRPPELGVYDGPTGPLNMDKPPYPLPYEWGNAYYSFQYAGAHFVMISSYSAMEPDSQQYNWLVQELQSVDRNITPWVIAVLHVPVYNTFSLHQNDPQIKAAKEHLEPLFVDHKVNLVLTGHIHAYMRTTAVAHDEPHPQGPVYITVGAGGRKCEAPFKNPEPESWLQVRDATIYGYGMLRILNATHAEWDWIHTGHNEDRSYNELWKSEQQLPSGPGRDRVFIENQYYL